MAELQVNINSYVSLEEAENYIQTFYTSTSAERVKWGALTEDDKKIVLLSSARALNNLRYKGQKKIKGQPLAFPRKYQVVGFGLGYVPYTSQYIDNSLYEGAFGSGDGLAAAKEAQIVNAVTGVAMDSDIITDVLERSVAGIKSKSAGRMSESYDNDTNRASNLSIGIYNMDKVRNILNCWLSDSVFSL